MQHADVARGRGIPEAEIALETRPAEAARDARSGVPGGSVLANARTPANGAFVFPGVAPGVYSIVIRIREKQPANGKSFFESRSNTARSYGDSSWRVFEGWPYIYAVSGAGLMRKAEGIRRAGDRVEIDLQIEVSGRASVTIEGGVRHDATP